MSYVIEQPALVNERAPKAMETSIMDQARFDRIAAQAEVAKAAIGPDYGQDITHMPRQELIDLLRTKMGESA